MDVETSRIRPLPEDTINRIAAGEVVQRPSSALKELLENSLDAESTQIWVTVKAGGLKMLQIQDNGKGIHLDDLGIVCERFTTSKLSKFEDLQSVNTYGFRGEALASISHVAYLSITTQTKSGSCGYKANYKDGKLLEKPTACAATPGTTITVEELFYNMPIRKKALKSAGEEYTKILEVANRYAIHNPAVGFSVKKFGVDTADLKSAPNSTTLSNIGIVYGAALAKECIPFEVSDDTLQFKANGYVSNPNYSVRKVSFILFINHRLVQCQPLKRGFELLCGNYLPKNYYGFLYLSLDVKPDNIDVNVHPNKSEVRFLNEAEITEMILKSVEEKIVSCDHSRTYAIVNKLGIDGGLRSSQMKPVKQSSSGDNGEKRVYDHHLVRTDNREQKLDRFFQPISSSFNTSSASTSVGDTSSSSLQLVPDDFSLDEEHLVAPEEPPQPNSSHVGPSIKTPEAKVNDDPIDVEIVECQKASKLASVLSLQQKFVDDSSPTLREMIRDHCYCGCVTPRYALIQHKTDLIMINVEMFSEELFYQTVLLRFGALPVMKLTKPPLISSVVASSVEMSETNGQNVEVMSSDVAQLLNEKAPMLAEYFGLLISDGRLLAIPSLLDGYRPQFDGLGKFLVELAFEVDWEREEECFNDVSRVIAKFFSLKAHYCTETTTSRLVKNNPTWKSVVGHILSVAFKKRLLVPQSFEGNNTAVLKLTDLTQLYKVFERC